METALCVDQNRSAGDSLLDRVAPPAFEDATGGSDDPPPPEIPGAQDDATCRPVQGFEGTLESGGGLSEVDEVPEVAHDLRIEVPEVAEHLAVRLASSRGRVSIGADVANPERRPVGAGGDGLHFRAEQLGEFWDEDVRVDEVAAGFSSADAQVAAPRVVGDQFSEFGAYGIEQLRREVIVEAHKPPAPQFASFAGRHRHGFMAAPGTPQLPPSADIASQARLIGEDYLDHELTQVVEALADDPPRILPETSGVPLIRQGCALQTRNRGTPNTGRVLLPPSFCPNADPR